MTDTYKIYMLNTSADTQTFWCFLAPPQELVDDPGVFANSSASLAILSNMPGSNYFGIPVQYVVGAGASNQAVGLNVQVVSSVVNDASLEDTWDANYATVPPNEGPTMALDAKKTTANQIAVVSNAFAKSSNEEAGWFSNQTFGIITEAGFIGMSWSPSPQQTRTITPKLTFYVAIGDYGSNALASWDQVSNDSIALNVPNDFALNCCTITYDQNGNWSKSPGAPPQQSLTKDLSWFLSDEHAELAAIAYLSQGKNQVDTLKSVHYNSALLSTGVGEIVISGTITVGLALTAAFTYFFAGGTKFDVSGTNAGVTSFKFSYSGSQSVSAIHKLLTSGAQLIFGGAH